MSKCGVKWITQSPHQDVRQEDEDHDLPLDLTADIRFGVP